MPVRAFFIPCAPETKGFLASRLAYWLSSISEKISRPGEALVSSLPSAIVLWRMDLYIWERNMDWKSRAAFQRFLSASAPWAFWEASPLAAFSRGATVERPNWFLMRSRLLVDSVFIFLS